MLLKRCKQTEAALETPGVVVEDVILNHFYNLFSAGKAPAIVALPLEDAPKALHRAVVNALANPGHTLSHPGCDQLVVEHLGGILEAPVAVEQRVCVWMICHRPVERLVDQSVVVGVPDDRHNNPAVAQIEDSAEIDLVYHRTDIILKLGHVRQPFLIWPVRMELAVENVFRRMLRI